MLLWHVATLPAAGDPGQPNRTTAPGRRPGCCCWPDRRRRRHWTAPSICTFLQGTVPHLRRCPCILRPPGSPSRRLPVLLVPVLLGHRQSATCSLRLYDPAGHAATLRRCPCIPRPPAVRQGGVAVLAPVPVLAGQSVQAASLFAVPCTFRSGRQTLPPLPVYPASARQTTAPVRRPGVAVDRQASQAALDIVDDLYVPDKHGDTLVPLPVYPASARQALTAAECAGLCEWAGQTTHTLPSPW